VVCNVYFIEWEFCRIIPLSANHGISVGALYAGALQSIWSRVSSDDTRRFVVRRGHSLVMCNKAFRQ